LFFGRFQPHGPPLVVHQNAHDWPIRNVFQFPVQQRGKLVKGDARPVQTLQHQRHHGDQLAVDVLGQVVVPSDGGVQFRVVPDGVPFFFLFGQQCQKNFRTAMVEKSNN